MLETPSTGTRTASDAGFAEHLRSFAATGFDYLGARFQLAAIESREASGHYLKIFGLAAAALLALLFGYVFFIGSIVFILAYLLQVQWMWVMLACGLLHFAGAGLCLWIAKNRVTAPMFTATMNEFKKDRQWLNNQKF